MCKRVWYTPGSSSQLPPCHTCRTPPVTAARVGREAGDQYVAQKQQTQYSLIYSSRRNFILCVNMYDHSENRRKFKWCTSGGAGRKSISSMRYWAESMKKNLANLLGFIHSSVEMDYVHVRTYRHFYSRVHRTNCCYRVVDVFKIAHLSEQLTCAPVFPLSANTLW